MKKAVGKTLLVAGGLASALPCALVAPLFAQTSLTITFK